MPSSGYGVSPKRGGRERRRQARRRRRGFLRALDPRERCRRSGGDGPSTVLSLGADTSGGATAEPSDAVVFGLAFLMGLVLGPVLGFAQWLALRRFVARAALWMLANALAWAVGMVVIFAGIDPATSGGFGPGTVAILAATLFCAGAAVGAIHGLALVWLLRQSSRASRVR